MRQAIADAGLAPPPIINAAIAGNTAALMLARMDRDVLPHRPTLVLLNAGINDIHSGVPCADYEAHLDSIAARLDACGAHVLLLTTWIDPARLPDQQAAVREFNEAMQRVAERRGCRLARVKEAMDKAEARGLTVAEPDGYHPNFEGYRTMARAVLDALGLPRVPVPESLRPEPMPGIVREWRVRAAPADAGPLSEEEARGLTPDATWARHMLPEAAPAGHWWLDQERRRGFAVSLAREAGPARRYQAVAWIDEPRARDAFLNTGADLESVFLNGRLIWRLAARTGWHAGKERLPVHLEAGRNTIVIESGPCFFLSVTDGDDW